jgi:hypothetical protein
MEDPVIIRFNIQHYEALLQLVKDSAKRETIIKLKAEAEEQLRPATARDGPTHAE